MSKPATDIRVRPAQATDVEFLATTGRAMFAVSHGEAMLADDLAAYLDDAFEPSRLARHIARSDNIFLIAHVGDEPAGYVRLMEGPTSSFVSAPDAIE
ncbi:MAG TPA: hypothetical protein VF190_12785, partial [Rhodothermales bacterium]